MKLSLSTVEIFKHIHSEAIFELAPEQLSDLQGVLLEMVYDIDDFCLENGINYFLGGGSALGAVRHQGIIPWDDDIDINMFRCDYERFIRLFSENKNDKYWIHSPDNTKDYALQLARVRLKGTSVKTREDFFCDECGAFVDIFIIDSIPDNKILRWIHGTGSLGLGFLLSCRKFFRERKYLKSFLKGNRDFRFAYVVKTIIGLFTAIFPIGVWVRLNSCWNGLLKNKNTQYTTVPAGRKHYWKEILLREDILPERRMLFGDRYLPVYQHVEKYLSQLYGDDYMVVPEKKEMEKHILFLPFYLHNDEIKEN